MSGKGSGRLYAHPFSKAYWQDAAAEMKDTRMLKEIRSRSQRSATELLDSLDRSFIEHIMHKQDVIRYILQHGESGFALWIQDRLL